ncbi:MAG TPA: methionine adenosyltransferase [Candidatus Methylomirabilis sp.]|nr:methionine adenosyltransferase [Candidatus Methylomirabilis sp.]
MKLIVEALRGAPVAQRRIELVERKGLGHPDTLCDSLVEAVSLGLNRMYLEGVGRIPHYNIDKALLVAGQCVKGFGWGELTHPIELIVGDRATFLVGGTRLPVEEAARAAVDAWVGAHLPHVRPGKDLHTRVVLAQGSEELRRIFKDGEGAIGSNDTCGASGFAPLSPTEETVLAVERFLNAAEFKGRFPDTGQDVKVLGVRQDQTLTLTVAMPFLCREVASEQAYFQRKGEALAALAESFRSAPLSIQWGLNCLDRTGRNTEGAYLSLTGTSAEDADSGQVGRGNRVNGLIAFSRPTGGEAAAGKNPVAHAGKIYSVLSHRLAGLIHARCPDLLEVYVHLSVRIGEPVDQPWTGVQVLLPDGIALAEFEVAIRDVVEAELRRLPEFTAELIRGEYPVC